MQHAKVGQRQSLSRWRSLAAIACCEATGLPVPDLRLILGLHRISYPAPAPAEIRPNFHIRYGRRR